MGNPETEATIDIGLRPTNDTGAQIYSLPANKPAGLENGYRILSIDGKNITGKSVDEIKEIMKGPRGSQVKLQVLTKKGEVITVSVTRELAGTHPRAGLEERLTASSAEKLDLYDNDFLPTAYAESAHSGFSTVIEPYLTAQATIATKKAETWFGNSMATVAVYADLVPFYDRIGRIEIADELVVKITAILRRQTPDNLRSWHARDYSEYLQRSGRIAQSDVLNDLLGKKTDNHQPVETNYALASNALKAIEQKDTNTANELTNGLITNLEETLANGKYYNRQPIWFYLNAIERAYVNHGQITEASKLRTRLYACAKKCGLSDAALIPLQIDSCLTAAANGDANAWTQIEKSQVFAIPGTEPLTITPAEKLRRFALPYTLTADYKRARMLLTRAKVLANGSNARANNIASSLPSLSAHNEFADDETLALIILDTAILDLCNGKYSEAKSAVDTFLSTNLTIGQTAARKLAQIAFLYGQASRSDDGEKLLAGLIEKSKDKAADRKSRIAIPGFYQWKLSELLIKRGQDKAALPLIDAAILQYKSIGPYSGLLLPAAKLYERLGKYEQAATTYFDTQASLDSHSSYRGVDFRSTKRAMLESAMACANKAPDLPPETKAKIVRSLAGYVGTSDPTRQIALERQEMSLLTAGSKESVNLAMATTRRLKSQKAPTAELIESMSTAANLAIKGNNRQAPELLIELATTEVSNNQISQGIAHAEEALQINQKAERSNSAVEMITRHRSSIAEVLYKAGHTSAAEALIKKAQALDSTASSDRPNIETSSVASLTAFYFTVGEKKKAESLLNDLFAKYASGVKEGDSRFMSKQRLCGLSICRIAASLGFGASQRTGLDIAIRLLTEQRKLFGATDLQQAETLKVIGQIYERSGQMSEAEATYREILTLYEKHPEQHMDLGFKITFSSFLSRIGKDEEARKLRDMMRH